MKIITYTDKYKEQVIKLIFDIAEIELGHKSKTGRIDVKNISEFYQKTDRENFWIAIDENDNVVGTIGLLDRGNGNGELERMYVKKEIRRKGIATKLLTGLLSFAKRKQYKKIYLSIFDEPGAKHSFYKNSGFEEVKLVPKEIDHPTHPNVFYKLQIK